MSIEARPEQAEPESFRNDEKLIMYLERDQLVSETARPVVPAQLGRRAVVGLWGLRIFAILVSAMVVYTFIARLN
jgi:hypothetical protein